jgi:hypothetical protein
MKLHASLIPDRTVESRVKTQKASSKDAHYERSSLNLQVPLKAGIFSLGKFAVLEI